LVFDGLVCGGNATVVRRSFLPGVELQAKPKALSRAILSLASLPSRFCRRALATHRLNPELDE